MRKVNFNKKLIIGSANFAKKYGTDVIKINQNEITKILNFAKKNKINKIDSAESYFNKKDIFKNIDKSFQITTKIIPDHKWISLDYCQKKLDEHFKLFNGNKIQSLLFHDYRILLNNKGLKIYKNLENLKKKNYFKNIGLSIYDTKPLEYLISNYNFDVVQCPFNILDKRILHSGWFDRLKVRGIEIHARSIFLQGLLVNEAVYKKKYFKRWKKNFSKWFQMLKSNNISPINYCLNDLFDHDFDKIIIGINNCDNLKEIVNFKRIKNKEKIKKFEIDDLKLIDPRNWK